MSDFKGVIVVIMYRCFSGWGGGKKCGHALFLSIPVP